MHSVVIKSRHALLSALTVFVLFMAGAHAEVADYGKVGWWSIVYASTGRSNSCSAIAMFSDQTIIQLALVQRGSEKVWAVFASNAKWDSWLASRSKVTLIVVTTKAWRGTFTVIEGKQTVMTSVPIDFVNSVAGTDTLMIFNDKKQPLTEALDMKDSQDAVKSVVHCVQAHPLTNAPSTPSPESEPTISGTGFFVSPNLVLTDNHVVKDCDQTIHVRYPDRPAYQAVVFGQDETNDLALLHVDMSNPSIATFRVRPQLGESVATYGFPFAGILSSSGNFTLGNITSLSGIKDDSRVLQMSTPVQPGNSGGPLLDMSGNVVGVVVGQLNSLAMMQQGNSVPQDINFAIQVPIVLNFLFVKGLTPKLVSAPSGKTLTPVELADMAKQFTIQVYCQRGPSRTSALGGTNAATASNVPGDLSSRRLAVAAFKVGHTLSDVSSDRVRRFLNSDWRQMKPLRVSE